MNHSESALAQSRRLRRLAQASPLLADLSMADVVVVVPVFDGDADASPDRTTNAGDPAPSPNSDDLPGPDRPSAYRVVSHVRPMNARTVYPIDQVGQVLPAHSRPLVDRAFRSGEIMDGGVWLPRRSRWIRTLAVPVPIEGEVVAVLAREFSPQVELMPGDLELLSFATFRRFATMIAAGGFPFGVETRRHDHPPRVGDGIVLLGRTGRLEYASPNALTVMRQIGATQVNIGQHLGDIGIEARGMQQAYANQLDYTDEIELTAGVLSTWCIPLIEQGLVTGSLVLVRNITELRQRDRLLLTKDATIAEIHHRVKNSLQTVSSLLQLQSRRVDSDDARAALADSARRIRSIGVVHELLSHRTDDEVQFGEILQTLTAMIRDLLVDPGHPVSFEIQADPAVLPNNLTTPMSLIASELIQNAIDHAAPSRVRVRMLTAPGEVVLEVADDGCGFGPDFSFDTGANLGLTIVRTIAESELSGSIKVGDAADADRAGGDPGEWPGGFARVKIPLFDQGAPM